MKKLLKIAVSKTTVNHIEKEVDLPESAKYYMIDGEVNSFYTVLFAIIPKYKDHNGQYRIVEVRRNQQLSTDFIPTEDLGSDYWLDKGQDLRKKAWSIITNEPFYIKKEITEADFEEKRMSLINDYKK